jgi:hypothetical protein
MRSSRRRVGLYERMEQAFRRSAYQDRDEAIAIARLRASKKKEIKERRAVRRIRG